MARDLFVVLAVFNDRRWWLCFALDKKYRQLHQKKHNLSAAEYKLFVKLPGVRKLMWTFLDWVDILYPSIVSLLQLLTIAFAWSVLLSVCLEYFSDVKSRLSHEHASFLQRNRTLLALVKEQWIWKRISCIASENPLRGSGNKVCMYVLSAFGIYLG